MSDLSALMNRSSTATSPAAPRPHGGRRRAATTLLLAALVLTLLLAVPGLRPVLDELREMSPAWIAAALALELASSISFVVVFRLFFDRLGARDARALAWTSMASGALLPGGGVGGLAMGGWLMRLAGAPLDWIVRRSSGLFFLTTAVNSAAVIAAGALLVAGVAGPHDFDRAALPLLLAAVLTVLVIAAAHWRGRHARAPWLDGVADGVHDAERAALHPSWRLSGAFGYLFFDVAALWATFAAVGHAPPVAALMLGYSIGYIANAAPVPGGIGVLDAGLVGALLLYGAAPADAAAAVLVYHAIAFWIPALGGLLAYARLRPRLSADALAHAGASPQPRRRRAQTQRLGDEPDAAAAQLAAIRA
jgi:uncharacterized membrane protein YbhN (UPF0104 family)